MFNLIMNEHVKIYRRTRTWVMVAILLAVIGLFAGVLWFNIPHKSQAGWRQIVVSQNQQLEMVLNRSNAELPTAQRAVIKQEIQQNNTALAQNIDPTLMNAWSFIATGGGLSALVIIFGAVVAGDIVAAEFSAGTIKLLLIRPATRLRILSAKYITAVVFSLFLMVLLILTLWAIGFILFGAQGGAVAYIYVNPAGAVREMSIASFTWLRFALLFVQTVMVVTLSFMISAAFRSSALAIALSLLVLFVGGTVSTVLHQYSWSKYLLFDNLNLLNYIEGGPPVKGMTLSFSIVMLVLYWIAFLAVSWALFTKRDITA